MIIAYTETAIWGFGPSEAEAREDALDQANDYYTRKSLDEQMKYAPATQALCDQVEDEGGLISWDRLPNGTHCTLREADGETS
jgi:hypothetical protein